MHEDRKLDFATRVIHQGQHPGSWQGATLPPLFQNASHLHPTAQSLSDTFGGKKSDHIYMRLTNPTNRILEEKLAGLEGGAGAVVMASGMAAINNACMALLRAGDEFVCTRSLFMSTYILFANIFAKYDIKARMVDSPAPEKLAAAINNKTRFIYLETIGNPMMDVPDIDATADMAHKNGLPLLIDNTLASPWLCRPIEHGADVVIHSTTKYFSGHGQACGGVVIDSGNFDWNGSGRFPDLAPYVDRKYKLACLDKIWREHHINFGTTMAPMHSYLTFLGLDTLALRLERHQENTIKVARFLKGHPAVKWINYPGLETDPNHAVAGRVFAGRGYGGVLTFGLADRDECFRFIDRLKLIYHLANLGDCKTLVIHPASSQYLSFPPEARKELAITDDLIRLSVGIETADDIIADLDQALKKD